jgi:uncharacterized phiE125 gp8 family phage protein
MAFEHGDWSISLLEPPAAEPLTLDQAKAHLKVTWPEEDSTIGDYLTAARAYIEDAYGIRLVRQKVEVQFQNFPLLADRMKLPIAPVQSVDYFRYFDVQLVQRVMVVGTDLHVRLNKRPPELILPYGKVWPPVVLDTADPIRIGLAVGFVNGHSPETLPVPPAALSAMRLLLTHQYENRAAVTLGTLEKTDPLALGVAHLMANVALYF